MPTRNAVRLLLAALLLLCAPAAAQGVPVLCYHGFAEAPEPRNRLTETYDRFEETLRFLRSEGFRSAFPDEVERGEVDVSRAVVITFDDGLREHVRAAEMLERHGYRGVFFVIPALLEAGSERHLSREDVERLVRAGHRVEAHGYRHRSMVASGAETAAALARSAGVLEARLPDTEPLRDFAFPFGHYSPEIVEALAGRFRYQHTVNPGYWDGRSPLVPRMLLVADVPLAFYRDYLTGGGAYGPAATLLGEDAATGGELRFRLGGALPAGELSLLVISADRAGTMYSAHPLGSHAVVEGDTLRVDLRGFVDAHFPPERRVVSYAVVARDGDALRWVSPGHMQWLE